MRRRWPRRRRSGSSRWPASSGGLAVLAPGFFEYELGRGRRSPGDPAALRGPALARRSAHPPRPRRLAHADARGAVPRGGPPAARAGAGRRRRPRARGAGCRSCGRTCSCLRARSGCARPRRCACPSIDWGSRARAWCSLRVKPAEATARRSCSAATTRPGEPVDGRLAARLAARSVARRPPAGGRARRRRDLAARRDGGPEVPFHAGPARTW